MIIYHLSLNYPMCQKSTFFYKNTLLRFR